MRFVTYASSEGPRVAAVHKGQYVDLNKADAHFPSSLKALLAQGPEALKMAAAAAERAPGIAPKSVKLLAPIPDPQKVLCVGLNYADHARESGMQPPAEPVYFNKFPTAVAAHEQTVMLP